MLTPNRKLGPYEIVAPLGAGGMGEVFRAKDTRLDREVAVKVLPDRLIGDSAALARFEREAKAIAALSHPNILAVYDVGIQGNTSYVVTELLEGESLRERLHRSPIPWRRAVEIATAMADGLAAAHSKGIVHRDLKPENVFLTSSGVVKILDFGLAHVEAPPGEATGSDPNASPTMTLATRPGAVLGTVSYMSPEQVRGLRTDARSDVFSFGCVLYEMLTGRRAFVGATAADTMTAVLREEPSTLEPSRLLPSSELERVITRCLEKRPEQRFQSATDLAFSLRSILSHADLPPPPATFPKKWFARAGVGVVILVVVLLGLWAARREIRQARRAGREVIDSLAVLPLENVSRDPEQEYFVDGMTDALISDLAKIGGLRVISRTSAMQYKGAKKPLPQIARELNVDAVVEGSVLRVGERVRITARLIEGATEQQLWAESYEPDLRDVLHLYSEVARTIAQEVKVTLTPQEQARMVEARPVNPDAYQAYVKGRFYWNKRTGDGFQKAVEYFEQAIALAPDWALGYAGLADAYVLMPQYSSMRSREVIPKARAAAAKALEMDESLAEAHVTMAFIAFRHDWDLPLAQREFERALALSPSYATAHQWYSEYLRNMGRYQDSLREITKAQELDPLALIIGNSAGGSYYYAGDLAQAETQLRKTLQLDPGFAPTHRTLARTLFLQGRLADAITEAREAVRLSSDGPYYAATLGYVCAKGGQPEEARRILGELTALSKEAYVVPTHFAWVYAGLDERDRMFEWLETAYQESDGLLPGTLTDPLLAPMRTDPRFADLVRRIGLPPMAPIRGTHPPQSPLMKGGGAAASRLGKGDPSSSTLTKGGGEGVTDGKIMLAVLPFANDSGDSELDYLSDGIAETLINGFSRIETLSTVPRSLAFQHKGVVDPVEAGRQLAASAVLSGRVLKRGDNLTVQADLVDVVEGRQLWGERYQKKVADLVEIERDIAKDITDALQLRLTGENRRNLSRGYTDNAEAYRLYLQGRFWWNKRTKEGFDNALRLLSRAVEIDPTFALAHAGIADTYSLMPLNGLLAPREALARARTAAERALQLDDELAEAHTSRGMVRFYLEWDLKEGERDLQRAIGLNPRYATAHQWYALNVGVQGRMPEARSELRRAIELDPLAPIFHHNLGWVEYWERNWDESLSTFEAGLDFAPEFPLLHLGAGLTLLEMGRHDEAVAHLRRSRELAGADSFITNFLGYGLARTGHEQEARGLLAERIGFSQGHYVPPMDVAGIYVGLGELEEAFRWLEKAYEVRDTWMMFLGVLPEFEPLRSDPRFADLVRRVGLPPLAPTPSKGASARPPSEKIMLAVLPFENLSRDPEQDYFSDGLTEEMISQLSRLNPKKLGVIARTSAMHYKNTAKTIDAIGRELGVAYIVEGSVRRAGERVRITAQLIQVSDQTHLWAENYERDLKDIFALQSDVAERVAGSLTMELLPGTASTSARPRTINPAAHEAYLKGRFYLDKRTADDDKKAVEYFEEAITLEPNWPLGYVGLADVYLFTPAYGHMRPSESIPKARAAATKALELDESLGEGHACLARIASVYDWDWAVAERTFQRALGLSPNHARAHEWYAQHLMRMGHHDEAIREITKALELDPLSLNIGTVVGVVYYYAGNFAQSESATRRTLELDPNFAIARRDLAKILLVQGRFAEAVTEGFEAVRLSDNNPWCVGVLGHAYAKAGQPEAARKALDELAARSKQAYVAPAMFAMIYSGLGETKLTLDWLERAYQERDPLLISTLRDPLLAPMRSDPRFADLVRRVGLPPPPP